MEPRLTQHQSQKMALSPQIRQYLKLLQLPLPELEQAIEAELSENPLLEEKTVAASETEPPETTDGSAESEAAERTEELKFDGGVDPLTDLPEFVPDSDLSLGDPAAVQKSKDYQESLLTKPEALWDFLSWQIRFLDLGDFELKIAEDIIGNINEDGYLTSPVEEISQRCHATSDEVEGVLKRIQELDPPGIAARNLPEALYLQLIKKGPRAALAAHIVRDHLNLLEKRDWHQLAKVLSVDIGRVRDAAEIIGHLDPRPGRIFYTEESTGVVPDAGIAYDDNNNLKIEIYNESIPELRINPHYRRLLRDPQTDAKTKHFIREKIQNAMNLIRALSLRQSTLREITEAIVKAQPDFFEKGFAHLRPLRLKDIASQTSMHESTVSRAISGKYVSTPQGMIPYRSFFSTKVESAGGEAESQKSMMEKIRTLIQHESKAKPLSDQEIVKIFKAQGIVIARRTVAKYRDLLKILPSHMRREK